MKNENRITAAFLAAFRTMIPIITGIVPTALAYALFAISAGIKPVDVLLSSLIVFAGSVQFITVELVRQGAGYIQFAIIVFLLHSRHMFFGISLFDKLNKTGKFKPLMIYGVTDESYAIMTSQPPPKSVDEGLFYIFITAIMYSFWNIGTALGVFASGLLSFNTAGMDFALTAMFIVIMVEQLKSYKTKLPFIIGGASCAVSALVIGVQSMLLGCCVASVIALLALRNNIERTEAGA